MLKKKLLGMGMAAVMMLSLSIAVFADEASTEQETETETEALSDVLYAKYQEAAAAGNDEEAMSYLYEGAEIGDTRSIMVIGQNYMDGNCVEQDYEEAMVWLKQASDAGDRKAPRYVAMMYQNGWGTEVDLETAAEYYAIAAERGDVTSMYYLGRCYEYGLGVEQDYEQALQLYTDAVSGGGHVDAGAYLELAGLYEHGRGVEQDTATAEEYYALAEEAGSEIITGVPSSVTAITEVYGNGQRISAVAIEYDSEIKKESVDVDTYTVEGRNITAVYTNTEAATTDEPVDGNYVIIELDITDDEASVYDGGIENGGNGPTGTSGSGIVKDVFASVTQVMGIITTDDNAVTTDSVTYDNTESINLVIDNFEQYVYIDPENGNELAYNLYIPEDYSEDEEYPLVLFMADASADGDDVMLVLRQGNGATVWATAEEQEKHACFVLAPQFPVDKPDDIADTVIHLIESLEEEYSIDSSRLYTTGQSAGCIRSFYFGINYPDFFAAYLLVSGQPSDGDDITVMEGDNVWIIVSEGDSRGYPGMTTVVETWEADGVAVTTDVWDATWSDEELNSAAEAMRAEGTDVKCTFYAKGTTWDGDPEEEDPNEHNSCMHVAYDVEAVRDWLFDQVLGESNP